MEFHTSGMAGSNHELQGVPALIGISSLLACEETAPRLVIGNIERIGLRPHLEDDGIHACLLKGVELFGKTLLLLGRSHAVVLPVDDLHPCPTKLPLRNIIVCKARGRNFFLRRARGKKQHESYKTED